MSAPTAARRTLVLDPAGTATASAITARLKAAGHDVDTHAVFANPAGQVDGFVYEPGLLDGTPTPNAAERLLTVVSRLTPVLRPAEQGGSRIVIVASRDSLGWPSRPELAAQSGALISAARSLALQLGRTGTTVNVISALPPEGSRLRAADRPENTHLYEPTALTPQPVTVDDIAETVAFFLDQRSGYITGQVLNCCGGASLLSSLSV
ncbi:SDR family oxidoreductase [Streptomyces rubiginosohelvolus]|uniref:SDR family oxidoreductase n=1 Tax=Streptomyces rubiginosohelvolus TaxID=67362 RepID=UPI003722137D